jgi:hypothetical protein
MITSEVKLPEASAAEIDEPYYVRGGIHTFWI